MPRYPAPFACDYSLMNNPRSFLLLALLMVGYLIWNQWQQDYGPHAPTNSTETPSTIADKPASQPGSGSGDTPAATLAPNAPSDTATTATPTAQLVEVTTDVLRLAIDPHGGNVVRAELLAYPQQPKDFAHPVRLLDDKDSTFFVAQSGLVAGAGKAPDHQAEFHVEKTSYALDEGHNELEIPLTWEDDISGLSVRKVYTLHRGSYAIDLQQEIRYQGPGTWNGNAYRQLQRTAPATKSTFTNPESYSFVGAAWYSDAHKFSKAKFDKYSSDQLCNARDTDLTRCTWSGGWASMLQHYFFAAWIPPSEEKTAYQIDNNAAANPPRYLIRALGPSISIPSGGSATNSARLYVGPKLQSTLDQLAPGLAKTADYGMLDFIAEPLHWVLSKLHALVGNWGLAIILLVLLIKAALFKLTEAQFRSMAKMRKLQPRMAALKERYGEDRQKMNQAMMELYQKEKINPLGGCLPMLIQMPVFLAFYWVLLESVELRQAPFVGWLQNLSAPDPYFVLPILNGATMILAQHLTPTTGMDPVQAKMMKIMPVMFAVMFAFFPSGLVLYWVVNGLSSLIQQWIITKRIEAGEKA